MPIRTESKYSKKDIFIHMKTTIDIPNKILAEVHLYSNRKSKKDAILTAMQEYVQKKKMKKILSKVGYFRKSYFYC
jgi:predicted DNA-binding protein YlxM (UPF0122 family)